MEPPFDKDLFDKDIKWKQGYCSRVRMDTPFDKD